MGTESCGGILPFNFGGLFNNNLIWIIAIVLLISNSSFCKGNSNLIWIIVLGVFLFSRGGFGGLFNIH